MAGLRCQDCLGTLFVNKVRVAALLVSSQQLGQHTLVDILLD